MVATKKVPISQTIIPEIVTASAPVSASVPEKLMTEMRSITFSNPNSLDKFGESTANVLSNMVKDMSTSETKLKEMGEIGNNIALLMKNASSLDPSILLNDSKPNIFVRLFKGVKDPIEMFALKQKTVQNAMRQVSKKLLDDRKVLLSENENLERVYKKSDIALNEMEEYLKAGAYRVIELKQELEIMKTNFTNNQDERLGFEIQTANQFVDRFERRIDRFNSARALVMRKLPGIRMMQTMNSEESETIKDCADIAVPEWESQIELYVSQLRTKLAGQNREKVQSMLNDSIRKNSELMGQNADMIIAGMNSSLFEIETIRTVNQTLINTAQKLANASEEGRQKRIQNFRDIQTMDSELKEALK